MSSMMKTARASSAKPKRPKFNPARAVNDRDWRRQQQDQINASRASSLAASPPPPTARPQSKCVNPTCPDPRIVDGTCVTCGAVAEEASNIVSEVTFGETATGQAVAQGTRVDHGQAGPRMDMINGRRRVAGGGDAAPNQETLNTAKLIIQSVCNKCRLSPVILETAPARFKDLQQRGFCKGRTVKTVAGVSVYWAIRNKEQENTSIMLIDIADALEVDVFQLGRTFKLMLAVVYKNARNCPFEPLFPEDILKTFAVKLGFYDDTHNVLQDAVRILQRMDRDWIVLGRKPNAICGSAIIIAARMNNFRRSTTEVAIVSKTTEATLRQRLDEFARVPSSQMSISDFKNKQFIPESHDPPAYYRQTKEFQEEQAKRKAARKRKRGPVNEEEAEEHANSTGKRQRTTSNAAANGPLSPDPAFRVDGDGFAIPAQPLRPRSRGKDQAPAAAAVSEDDISEALPTNDEDQEDALAAKYGDMPLPDSATADRATAQISGFLSGAKTIRKNRVQGSSLRQPVYLSDQEKWQTEEEEAARVDIENLLDEESEVWIAASKYAGLQKQELIKKVQSALPFRYQDGIIDNPEVAEDEFADDPEVQNCLLKEDERKVKEKLWLNANKEWLREQQEKEYKAKRAPPKKPRKHNRRARIGEGQTSPASSAGDAIDAAAKRLNISSRLNYGNMNLKNMFGPKRGGPGSVIGSEATSRQTSRAGSEEVTEHSVAGDSDDEAVNDTEADEDDEHGFGEDYDDEQFNNNEDEEYGGGGEFD